MIELYQYETCPFCRMVRQKLSELGLDFLCRNAPPGRPDKDRALVALTGSTRVPVLVDPDEGILLTDASLIVDYLEQRYGARLAEMRRRAEAGDPRYWEVAAPFDTPGVPPTRLGEEEDG